MSQSYTYTLSLIDNLSSPMRNVGKASIFVNEKIDSVIASQNKFQSINNKLGGSIASLRAKMDMLRQEREIISPANFKDINKYNKEIGKLEKQLEAIDNIGKKGGINLGRLNLVAGMQQVQAVSEGIANIASPAMAFNQSMADFSAITGIAGKELKDLGDVAKKTGAQSGLGAIQGVEAFKLLASQIDVSKIGMNGLKELQTKTITLAQASGMTMAESATALAGTVNQFGLSASEADRVINVLAAGSKYGAAEIPELAQSFKVVGAAANAAGLSVESTAGAIEILSKNNLKGAEAGTALRNIVLKMQTELGVDFSKTSLSSALDSLKPKLKDATYLSKLFGMENIAAAQFLITNSGAVQEMTDRVTDTNVAQEQAAIRTDTWQAKLDKMRAKVDNLKIGLIESTGSAGLFATAISEQAVTVSQLVPLFSLFGGGLKSLFATDATGKMRLLTIATSAYKFTIGGGFITSIKNFGTTLGNSAVMMKLMAAAQWMLNISLFGCPIVWIVVAIGALVGGIVLLWNKCEGFRKVVLGVWEVMKGFGSILTDVIIGSVKNLIGGLGSLGSAIFKLFKGDFKGAAQEAKEGAIKLFKSTPIGMSVDLTTKIADMDVGKTYKAGAEKGIKKIVAKKENFATSTIITEPQNVVIPEITNEIVDPTKAIGVNNNLNSVSDGKVNLNNMKGTTDYAAIMSMVKPVSIARATGLELPERENNYASNEGDAINGRRESTPRAKFDRICNDIIINIKDAGGQSMEQIRDIILDTLETALV